MIFRITEPMSQANSREASRVSMSFGATWVSRSFNSGCSFSENVHGENFSVLWSRLLLFSVTTGRQELFVI